MFNCECGAELIQDDCETILDVCQEAPVVKDYETLANKPQINGVTLDGNKTSEDLGITQEIADAVSAEATLRENADTALGGRIDGEATARENADTTLGGRIDGEITNRTNADNALGTRIDNEILARQGGDNNLQTQIDAITSKSDVVDVVANYAALQAYDTQHLGNNDVIKVLDDETHDDAQTYYRWNKTAGTWSYIGSEAPYYSKGQMDTMLQAKQDKLIAGTNIQIAQDGKTISATDTTYTAGNGLNLNGTEFSADTTVLATKSDLDSYYTKTETDTKLAPKLEAEVVAELPSTGTEGKLYLTPKNYTTGTATGNPITISLGEDAGQIESLKLDGDTFQQSYVGKNLINPSAISGTNNGITYSFDPATNEITLDGTATAKSTCYFSNENRISLDGEYTLSYEKVSGSITPTGTCRIEIAASSWGSNTIYLDLQDSSASITATKTFDVYAADFNIGQGTVCNNFKIKLQLEKSASTTSYEPYVGGQPSPSPSYPQQIQTVTGEQTVEIVGKNLFDKSNYHELACWINNRGKLQTGNNWTFWIPCLPSTTYTIQKMVQQPTAKNRFQIATSSVQPEIGTQTSGRWSVADGDTTTSHTYTTAADAKYLIFNVGNYDSTPATITTKAQILESVQVELGSTASSYAPYSNQTLPISLGTIELCKLGTYQDYIWKDGNDWKVHKDIGKYQFNGAEPWVRSGSTTSDVFVAVIASALQDYLKVKDRTTLKSPYFIQHDSVSTASGQMDAYNGAATAPVSFALSFDATSITNITNATTWISNNKPTVYSAINNPTDTVITDQALIAQLEAIRTASLQASNTITNTATGTNLAGDMELGYYEYGPTNRYDKWLWLDLNNNYEKLGS